MTEPNVVFKKFVDANPVPDVSDVYEPSLDFPTIISEAETRSDELKPSTPATRRGAWAAAAVFLLVLAVGGLFRTWPDQPASQPTAEPESPEQALRRDAVSAAEEWLAALNAGDIDQVIALSGPGARSQADQRVHEWQAGLAAAGMPIEVEACEVVSVTGSMAQVECEVRFGDLVAVELSSAELVAPFDYNDGLITWQPYTGGSISEVNDAYASYLRLFRTTEYEARCSPAAYAPGAIIQDRGLALTGECAQLAGPLAADVAQWIRDGRPEDQP